jgi:hypothetical protein
VRLILDRAAALRWIRSTAAVWRKASVLEALAIVIIISANIWKWRCAHPRLWLSCPLREGLNICGHGFEIIITALTVRGRGLLECRLGGSTDEPAGSPIHAGILEL